MTNPIMTLLSETILQQIAKSKSSFVIIVDEGALKKLRAGQVAAMEDQNGMLIVMIPSDKARKVYGER